LDSSHPPSCQSHQKPTGCAHIITPGNANIKLVHLYICLSRRSLVRRILQAATLTLSSRVRPPTCTLACLTWYDDLMLSLTMSFTLPRFTSNWISIIAGSPSSTFYSSITQVSTLTAASLPQAAWQWLHLPQKGLCLTLENGQSLFFLVMLASELLGLEDSEAVLPKPSALVKLDDIDGDKAEPTVTPSLTLQTTVAMYCIG